MPVLSLGFGYDEKSNYTDEDAKEWPGAAALKLHDLTPEAGCMCARISF